MRVISFTGLALWFLIYSIIDYAIRLQLSEFYVPAWALPALVVAGLEPPQVREIYIGWVLAIFLGLIQNLMVFWFVTYLVRSI